VVSILSGKPQAKYFIDGESSTLLEILLGVTQAQGSILAPLLFLIYINCLPLATYLLTMLYADDTTFFNEAESIDDLYSKTNLMLSEAEQWFLANRLTLHPAKTRYMLSSSNSGTRYTKNSRIRTRKVFQVDRCPFGRTNELEAPCHSCQTKNGGSNVTCL
jgi:hypothetical protein